MTPVSAQVAAIPACGGLGKTQAMHAPPALGSYRVICPSHAEIAPAKSGRLADTAARLIIARVSN